MDPLSLMSGATSLIGMGMEAFGMSSAKSAASAISGTQNAILGQEEQENQARQQAMNLSAQRQQVQNIRNTQRARAMGIAAAVGSGAQFGSGTGGGQGQAAAQGAVNTQGIVQNQQIGNQIFGIDANIDNLKMLMGQEQTSLYNAQGMMAMGGAISGSSQKIGQLGATGFGMLNNMFAPNLGWGD